MSEYASTEKVPGAEAIASVAANSPNDRARTQVGTTDPRRYCTDAPHVKNEDNMGGGSKGDY